MTFNQGVLGSSPSALTNKKACHIKDLAGLNIPETAYRSGTVPTHFPQTANQRSRSLS
jgi:hypothetical protein